MVKALTGRERQVSTRKAESDRRIFLIAPTPPRWQFGSDEQSPRRELIDVLHEPRRFGELLSRKPFHLRTCAGLGRTDI